MPILVPLSDCSWSQTPSAVTLEVPLATGATSKAAVYCNDLYVKVNAPPYFCDVDLYAAVNDEEAVAAVGGGYVRLTLPKVENNVSWPDIRTDITDPAVIARRRADAEERVRKRAEEARTAKAKERREQESLLIREQMAIERAEKDRIANLKKAEHDAAAADLDRWRNSLSNDPSHLHVTFDPASTVEARELNGTAANDGVSRDAGCAAAPERLAAFSLGPIPTTPIFTSSPGLDEDSGSSDEEVLAEAMQAVARNRAQARRKPAAPAAHEPRRNGFIAVTFTHRDVPHPARESRDSERLARSRLAKKLSGRRGAEGASGGKGKAEDGGKKDGMTPEEENSFLMKEKGDNFFRNENYQAAINAYDRSLTLDSGRNVDTLSNRAAAYRKLGNNAACAEDCARAIAIVDELEQEETEKMMEPPERGGFEEKLRRECLAGLLVRRATAMADEGAHADALRDYRRALDLDPKNQSLKADVDRLGALVAGHSSGQDGAS